MRIERFEDIIAWQKAGELTLSIYKKFKHFLFIAKGSCGEVRSMLYLALSLGYINQDYYYKHGNLSEEISKILSGLIKTL